MKKIYSLLAFLLLCKFFCTAQDFSKVWSTLYSDSTTYIMHINYHVVDAKGNSYVAGYKQYYFEFNKGNYQATHLFLLKVNAAGTQKWIRHFDNKNDSIDYPYGLALDTSGNIYITCTRIDTVINTSSYGSKINDIVTMKYDAAGNRVWLNRYHHGDYKQAQPSGITVSDKGEIVITGSDDTKAIVEKIDKDGNTIWLKKLKDVVVNTACFDKDYNIIIAGASNLYHAFQTDKPMVMKLSKGGQVLWSSTFDEYRKYGHLYFVQCDSANNIYANGQTDTTAFYNNPKIITIKYNSAGAQQWFRKEENYSNTLPPYEGDFAIDAAGNSYITGYVRLPSSFYDQDWLTTKYDNAGKRKWIAHYDDSLHGYDVPHSLALGKNGTVYVTGNTDGQDGSELLTIAYNKSGNATASEIYKPAKRSNGGGRGIGLDKKGNIYISAEVGFRKDTTRYITVVKYEIKKPLPVIAESPNKTIYDLQLYPNPVINMLNITFKTFVQAKKYYCTINNINGYEVLRSKLNNTANIVNANIDVHQLRPGIYTVSISNGLNTISEKFIKQ